MYLTTTNIWYIHTTCEIYFYIACQKKINQFIKLDFISLHFNLMAWYCFGNFSSSSINILYGSRLSLVNTKVQNTWFGDLLNCLYLVVFRICWKLIGKLIEEHKQLKNLREIGINKFHAGNCKALTLVPPIKSRD